MWLKNLRSPVVTLRRLLLFVRDRCLQRWVSSWKVSYGAIASVTTSETSTLIEVPTGTGCTQGFTRLSMKVTGSSVVTMAKAVRTAGLLTLLIVSGSVLWTGWLLWARRWRTPLIMMTVLLIRTLTEKTSVNSDIWPTAKFTV